MGKFGSRSLFRITLSESLKTNLQRRVNEIFEIGQRCRQNSTEGEGELFKLVGPSKTNEIKKQ